MPNPASLTTGNGARAAGVAASVKRAPISATDTIDVTWTIPADWDTPAEEGVETDVRWWCQPGATPTEGDYAMLMTDSRGDPAAFVFATGAP